MKKYYPKLFYLTLILLIISLIFSTIIYLNYNKKLNSQFIDSKELICPSCEQKECSEDTKFIELSCPDCPECNCLNCEKYCDNSIMDSCDDCYYKLEEIGEADNYCREYVASTDGFDEFYYDYCYNNAENYCDDYINDNIY